MNSFDAACAEQRLIQVKLEAGLRDERHPVGLLSSRDFANHVSPKNGDTWAVFVKQPRTRCPSISSTVLWMVSVEAGARFEILRVANRNG
jgi:hypothetical protein